jgi:type I restriction enzyme, S subunit
VPKLRRLILEVAVRGQLVPQNPDDEPASEILKRIEAEKKLSPIGIDEIFYEVPDNWAWGRLGEVSEIISGSTPKSDVAEYWDGNIVWITPTDLGRLKSKYINGSDRLISPEGYASCSATLMPAGSVVMSSRAPIGHLGIANVELCTNQGCKSFVPEEGVSSNYLYFALKAFVGQIKTLGSGTTFTEVSKTKLIPFLIPLPPVAEQQRIVAKVDELMALCDQLEAEQTERDHLRERTAKSTLFHLTDAPTHAEARRYWHYAEQHFPHLFDRSATVADLRATILQLGVQGRLVPQNPDDEPASELLKRIEAEKQRMVKVGEIGKLQPLPVVGEDEIPYAVPDRWVWVRLGEVTQKMGAGSTPLGGSKVYVDDGIPFLRSQNVWNDGLRLQDVALITYETHEHMSGTHVRSGDVLLNITGASIGRCAVVPPNLLEANVSQHVAILRLIDIRMADYLHLCVISPTFQQTIMDVQVGVSREGLSMTRLKLFPLAVPPFAEQQRIVAKVDELMALCDQLEAEAEACQALSGRLFDSIVHHLFASN